MMVTVSREIGSSAVPGLDPREGLLEEPKSDPEWVSALGKTAQSRFGGFWGVVTRDSFVGVDGGV